MRTAGATPASAATPSDDGRVTASDLDALRASFANPSGAPLSAGGTAKCTVRSDRPQPCSMVDVAVLRRALEPAPLAPGVTQACSRTLCATCTSAFAPSIGGCQIFPESDPWHLDISGMPVHDYSATYISTLDAMTPAVPVDYLRLDLGTTQAQLGIPTVVAPAGQALVPISYGTDGDDYSDESDPGPFPVPLDAPIQGGTPADPNPTAGDRHVIAIRQGSCDLCELWNTVRTTSPSGFMVSVSAHWNLLAPVERPLYWISASASGLPILPAILRREEFARGRIDHAIGVVVPHVAKALVPPARAFGPDQNVNYLPYGARLRLRDTFPEAGYGADSLVLIRALKKYGLMLVDQGNLLFVTGTSDPAFASLIAEMNTGAKRIPLSQFDIVQTGATPVCGWAASHCF